MHVVPADGLAGRAGPSLADAARACSSELGGTLPRDRRRPTWPAALVDFARAEKATQLVLGASRRSRWHELLRGLGRRPRSSRRAEGIDVHVIAQRRRQRRGPGAPAAGAGAAPRPALPAGAARRSGWVLAVVGLPAAHRRPGAPAASTSTLPTDLLLFLVARRSASPPSAGVRRRRRSPPSCASLLVNWFFVPPIHTLHDRRRRERRRPRRLRGRGRRSPASSSTGSHAAAARRCGRGPRPGRWPAPAAS